MPRVRAGISNKGSRSTRLCYLCGEAGADTRDHVPPRGMFPKQPKGNLITVPAHRACNEKYARDDERFRNYIVAMGSFTTEGLEAWGSQVLPSLPKNKKLLSELRNRLSLIRVDVASGQEGLALPTIQVDGALMQRQVKRITRGLFYHRFRTPLPRDWSIKLQRGPAQSIVEVIRAVGDKHGVRLGWRHVEPRVFSYCHGVLNEDERVGVASMVFFDTEGFLAFHGLQGNAKGLAPA